jgi:hypothetical protein
MGVNWHRGAGYNSYFVPGAQYHGGVASPGGIVAGDFNGDGHADFIVANTASHSMSVFTGDGDGNFAFRGDQYASEMALVMVAADFNKDGLLDLAYTQYDPGRVTVAINKGPCAKPRRGRPVSRP